MTRKIDTDALATVQKILKPGDTICCIVRSVAKSGMSRRIDFYFKPGSPEERWLTPFLVRLGCMDESPEAWRKHGDYAGAKISGCGMDMCFESVYRLGRVLWPEGFKVEGRGRNGDMSGHDTDGGYALQHRTI